jgi:PKD repeat protein
MILETIPQNSLYQTPGDVPTAFTKLVRVYEPPVAQFSWSDTSCTAGKIYFFDESFHNQGWAITQRLWDINNFESDLAEPVYIFPDVETTYPVSLIATDQRGCSDTLTEEIFVPAELSIDFTADTVCFGEQHYADCFGTAACQCPGEHMGMVFRRRQPTAEHHRRYRIP